MSKAYEVTALAKSGREGLVATTEGSLSLMMGSPNSINQKTDKNNPEQLFACGYASCFSQALFAVCKKHGLDIKEAPIKVTVQLDVDDVKGYNIYVGIEALIANVSNEQAQTIMMETHQMCPYSKLIKKEHVLFLKVNGQNITIA